MALHTNVVVWRTPPIFTVWSTRDASIAGTTKTTNTVLSKLVRIIRLWYPVMVVYTLYRVPQEQIYNLTELLLNFCIYSKNDWSLSVYYSITPWK